MANKKVENKKNQNSPQKKIVTAILCLAMTCGIIFFVSQIRKEVSTTISLYAGLSDAKSQLNELEEEKASLQVEKEKLSDSNYVSSVARGKYLISKSNEQIYVLPTLD